MLKRQVKKWLTRRYTSIIHDEKMRRNSQRDWIFIKMSYSLFEIYLCEEIHSAVSASHVRLPGRAGSAK